MRRNTLAQKWIEKIGLAAVVNGRLLVVRKQGGTVFILPGGKPEAGESDLQALKRELKEELGCELIHPVLQGVFNDVAAGQDNSVISVRLYSGDLIGDPVPQAEIEEAAWFDLRRPGKLPLAPSIVNQIVPYLLKQMRKEALARRRSSTQPRDKFFKDLFELA
jgi:8-oxo-dGTP diphosphatase